MELTLEQLAADENTSPEELTKLAQPLFSLCACCARQKNIKLTTNL